MVVDEGRKRRESFSFVDDPPLCISLQRFSASIMGRRSICGRLEFEKMAHGPRSEFYDFFSCALWDMLELQGRWLFQVLLFCLLDTADTTHTRRVRIW